MRDLRGPTLRAQATHTDRHRRLYKYVNGRLFVYRDCFISMYYPTVPCWCIVVVEPSDLFELNAS